jgi:hypothetical protein
VTTEFDETEAAKALAHERDRCAHAVLEFMSACGVRVTTMPPQLFELFTAYGFKAIDIGHALARAKRPKRAVEPPARLPAGVRQPDESGIMRTVDRQPALGDPGDVTRKIVLPSHRHG